MYMIGTIYINGIVGQDTTLLDVIRQVKAAKGATEYLVKIDSIGGYVDAGFAIFDYLKGLGTPITTYTTKAFSIASVLFMAGDKRIIPQGTSDAVMIHLPWQEVKGTSDTFANQAKVLKEVENKMIAFYSERLQIDENTIQSLLIRETFLDATEALEMGFATEIQPAQKAVAMINNKEKEDESLMNKPKEKALKKLSQARAMFSGVQAELILQDGTGAELVFPDLEPTDVAEVGEKATIDGKPAQGDFVMPDGSTIKVEGGVVSEIVPAEVEQTEEDEAVAEDETKAEEVEPVAEVEEDRVATLEAKVADLEAKIAELLGTPETEEVENKMLEVVMLAAEKVTDVQNKFESLAKQVGSDYQPQNKKETKPTVKAAEEQLNRAWQILNSK